MNEKCNVIAIGCWWGIGLYASWSSLRFTGLIWWAVSWDFFFASLEDLCFPSQSVKWFFFLYFVLIHGVSAQTWEWMEIIMRLNSIINFRWLVVWKSYIYAMGMYSDGIGKYKRKRNGVSIHLTRSMPKNKWNVKKCNLICTTNYY